MNDNDEILFFYAHKEDKIVRSIEYADWKLFVEKNNQWEW